MMKKHVGPIFSVRWNKSGTLLTTGGVDKSSVVWDVTTAEARQTFPFHQGSFHNQITLQVLF